MTNEQRAIRQWLSKPYPMASACGCLGPQGDDPVCPCAMRWVEKVDGIYYEITEHRSPDGVTHTAEKLVVEDPYAPKPPLSLQDRLKLYKENKWNHNQ